MRFFAPPTTLPLLFGGTGPLARPSAKNGAIYLTMRLFPFPALVVSLSGTSTTYYAREWWCGARFLWRLLKRDAHIYAILLCQTRGAFGWIRQEDTFSRSAADMMLADYHYSTVLQVPCRCLLSFSPIQPFSRFHVGSTWVPRVDQTEIIPTKVRCTVRVKVNKIS